MARYATKERELVCLHCDLKFAKRHAIPLQHNARVLGIVFIRCPRCNATHRDLIEEASLNAASQ